MVKEELCEKMVDVRRVSDRVMAVLLFFEEGVMRLFVGMLRKVKEDFEKNCCYGELKCERDMHSADDLIICLYIY